MFKLAKSYLAYKRAQLDQRREQLEQSRKAIAWIARQLPGMQTEQEQVSFVDQIEGEYQWQLSEIDHRNMIRRARHLFWCEPDIHGLVSILCNFAIGDGFDITPNLQTKEAEPTENENAAKQAAYDLFWGVVMSPRNTYYKSRRKIITGLVVDGERLLRFFPTRDEFLIRRLDPLLIQHPQYTWSYGIETDPEDIHTVINFHKYSANTGQHEVIPAEEIYHQHLEDFDFKRGYSMLLPLFKTHKRADDILKYWYIFVQIQSAFVWAYHHKGNSTTSAFKDVADKTETRGGMLKQMPKAGQFVDVWDESELKPLSPNVNQADATSLMRQFGLRMGHAIGGLPEYMATGDAGNNNYASIFDATNPALKLFLGLQEVAEEEIQDVYRRIVQWGKLTGRLNDLAPDVCIVNFPDLIHRDALAETTRREKLSMNGILSPQTWTQQEGYEFEIEQINIKTLTSSPEEEEHAGGTEENAE